MNLLEYLREHLAQWGDVLPQNRTLDRIVTLGFGCLCGVGKSTVTRAICFQGNDQKDWSADYKVFSRSPWEAQALFDSILETAIQAHQLHRIVVSKDDTRVWRDGKHVPQTQWHRDPMGPPFQTNLRWGHRFLQASLVLPLYTQDGESSARSVPIRFEMAPVVKKPGKGGSESDWEGYRQLKKEHNLSVQFVAMGRELRQHLNACGHRDLPLSLVGDGSFCNRTVFAEAWAQENVSLVVRCRKDIVLCKRARDKGRRFYGKAKFTPEKVRRRKDLAAWQHGQIFHGGCYRDVRYKDVPGIYWQGGAKQQELRVLVVSPVGYRTTKNGRKYYRQPAYLLTTDLTTPAQQLIQDYFDRWGIEVNHRDEKEILGVGEAQVWNEHSVLKVPVLLVAMYSWLLLAGLACYGPTRTDDYLPLPKWRRGAKRPSCQDLVNLLRQQIAAHPVKFATGKTPPTYETMVITAAA